MLHCEGKFVHRAKRNLCVKGRFDAVSATGIDSPEVFVNHSQYWVSLFNTAELYIKIIIRFALN